MVRNIVVGALGCALLACGSGGPTGKQIVLGAVVDQTGTEAESSWIQAAHLAVDQMNQALAAEGHTDFQFSLRVQDSENIPAKGVARALDMVHNQHASALIVDTTQVIEAVLSTFYDDDPSNDLGVPVQCSSCTSGNLLNYTYNNPAVGGAPDPTSTPILDDVRRNTGLWMQRTTMTTVPMAFVAGYVLNDHLPGGLDRNGDGIIKVAVIGSNEAFGQSGTAAIRANWPSNDSANKIGLLDLPIANDATGKLFIERILHPNAVNPADVDFNAKDPDHGGQSYIQRLLDDTTECEACAAIVYNGDSAHPVTPATSIADGHPVDYIIMITFQQFAANFAKQYKQYVTSLTSGGMTPDAPPLLHYHTFRQSGSIFQLGQIADGQIGISHGLVNTTDAGTIYARDFRVAYGFDTNFWDSGYYDNAMTFMLSALIAQVEERQTGVDPNVIVPNPTTIRDRMQCINASVARTYAPPATYPNPQPWVNCPADGATHVGPGLDYLRTAVREIYAGRGIDYDGASGPMDYDFQKNVRDTVEFYEVQGNKFVTRDVYNCLSFADNKCGVATPILVK